ncbi:putative hydroxymyristoyl-(Acyl carrier protein) dehydratase [Verrucomicrobia bacterium]|nr:putative hydroxymyristoyl-(Acyl carrier protein) dehydratase [Verrucomicrobiota bacterium]
MKFRLVDKITSWAAWQNITGVKAVSFEEYSLKEAFGEPPRLPELLLLESFLQLGNWLVMLSSDFRQMGMLARISEVRFQGSLLPGQRLQLEVRMNRRRDEGFELAGQGQADGRSLISGTGCVAALAPLAEYQNPEDLRVLFSEIYEPAGAPASLAAGAKPQMAAGKDVGAPDRGALGG